MQNIIVKAHTANADSAPPSDRHRGGPVGEPELSHAQHQRDWRRRLFRSLCYCSTIAPVPFVLPTPCDPRGSR
jgi:hypothetical protein